MTREEWETVRQAMSTPPRDTSAERERMERAYQANKAKTWLYVGAVMAAFLIVTLQTGGVL